MVYLRSNGSPCVFAENHDEAVQSLKAYFKGLDLYDDDRDNPSEIDPVDVRRAEKLSDKDVSGFLNYLTTQDEVERALNSIRNGEVWELSC